MEARLQQLFDLQNFVQNSRLQNVIDDVTDRYQLSENEEVLCSEIEETDLEMLSAAGDVHAAAGSFSTLTSCIKADKADNAAQNRPLGCNKNLTPGDFI